MITQHLALAFFWISYCVIHSFLAATKCKLVLKETMGTFFRYYRLLYTIFAAFTLALLLYFQYSFESPRLFQSPVMKYIALFFLVIPGLVIMLISIYKYFKLLSGIQTLFIAKPTSELKVENIHKYMRHPLYFGTLLFTWGLFFIFPLLSNLIAVISITLYTVIGIKLEEKKLVKEFGILYRDYQQSVPMLVPKLWS
ncbi:MAG: isoprenylcysteine carboxylmethyltransferase family protein [Ginsengibacter sp.]